MKRASLIIIPLPINNIFDTSVEAEERPRETTKATKYKGYKSSHLNDNKNQFIVRCHLFAHLVSI